jgi:hypothetical protein
VNRLYTLSESLRIETLSPSSKGLSSEEHMIVDKKEDLRQQNRPGNCQCNWPNRAIPCGCAAVGLANSSAKLAERHQRKYSTAAVILMYQIQQSTVYCAVLLHSSDIVPVQRRFEQSCTGKLIFCVYTCPYRLGVTEGDGIRLCH